jgi:SNF2 family DNA or RNA helicase
MRAPGSCAIQAQEEAVGRAHRMGQRRPVTVYRLVIQGSIEERIMALHWDKRALVEGLFGGESFGEALSLEKLAGLLASAAVSDCVGGGKTRHSS